MIHYSNDPVRDAERYQVDLEREQEPAYCDECGVELEPHRFYYNFGGHKVCQECVDDYISLFREWA